jgi:hypothetical protein
MHHQIKLLLFSEVDFNNRAKVLVINGIPKFSIFEGNSHIIPSLQISSPPGKAIFPAIVFSVKLVEVLKDAVNIILRAVGIILVIYNFFGKCEPRSNPVHAYKKDFGLEIFWQRVLGNVVNKGSMLQPIVKDVAVLYTLGVFAVH